MRCSIWILATTLVFSLGACNKKKSSEPVGKTPPKPPPLVSPETLAGLEQGIMQQVKQNQARKCVRPVLRGQATSGNADKDMVALIRPAEGSPLATCLAEARRLKKELTAAVASAKAPTGEVARLIKKCESLYAQVARAVTHGDACSPYLAGRRGLDRLGPLLAISKVVVLRMRALARALKKLQAAQLGLDFVRLSQDVQRGEGGTVVAGILGKTAAMTVLESGLRPLLAGWKGRAAATPLAAVAAELEVLEQTEPPFVHLLRYQTTGFVLQSILPQLKGETWTPPGGFEQGIVVHPAKAARVAKNKPNAAGLKTKKMRGVSEKEELALVWLASTDTIERLVKACPANARAEACARGILKESEAIRVESRQSKVKRLFKVALAPAPRKEIRQWILAILKAVGAPAFNKYVGNYATRALALRAARIQALASLQKAKTGKCPDLTNAAAAQKLPLRDPGTGQPLRVEKGKKGTVLLRPSAAPADRVLGKYYTLSYTVRCR